MTEKRISVCVLRVGGTNCDEETKRAFGDLGVKASTVHTGAFVGGRDSLLNYDVLVFPGGFSYGDHVRAGAIWSKRLLAQLGSYLRSFLDEGKPILGICNGFQVLVEMGLLPGFDGIEELPKAALAPNNSSKFECRWVYLRHDNAGKCIFTKNIRKGEVLAMPVAHMEGKFILPKDKEKAYLKRLVDNDQIVFRYCDEKGAYADGRYPDNPNGSLSDIAGICNPDGNVFGLMPHPERAYYSWQMNGSTYAGRYGNGRKIFESVVVSIRDKLNSAR